MELERQILFQISVVHQNWFLLFCAWLMCNLFYAKDLQIFSLSFVYDFFFLRWRRQQRRTQTNKPQHWCAPFHLRSAPCIPGSGIANIFGESSARDSCFGCRLKGESYLRSYPSLDRGLMSKQGSYPRSIPVSEAWHTRSPRRRVSLFSKSFQ